jgi:hypothetical protein
MFDIHHIYHIQLIHALTPAYTSYVLCPPMFSDTFKLVSPLCTLSPLRGRVNSGGQESEVRVIPRARVQDQGLCRVRDQESKIRVIPRARVQGLEQGSRSGFKGQGQSSRVRAVRVSTGAGSVSVSRVSSQRS